MTCPAGPLAVLLVAAAAAVAVVAGVGSAGHARLRSESAPPRANAFGAETPAPALAAPTLAAWSRPAQAIASPAERVTPRESPVAALGPRLRGCVLFPRWGPRQGGLLLVSSPPSEGTMHRLGADGVFDVEVYDGLSEAALAFGWSEAQLADARAGNTYELVFAAPGWAVRRKSIQSVRDDEEVVFDAEPPDAHMTSDDVPVAMGSLTGRVLLDGRPVGGLPVALCREPELPLSDAAWDRFDDGAPPAELLEPLLQDGSLLGWAVTDESGAFAIDGLVGGTAGSLVSLDARFLLTAPIAGLTYGAGDDETLKAEPAFVLKGAIASSDPARPLATSVTFGWSARALDRGVAGGGAGGTLRSYRVHRPMPPGDPERFEVEVRARAKGFRETRKGVTISAARPVVREDLLLEPDEASSGGR